MSSFCLWFMLISSLRRANSSWLHGFNPCLIQHFLAWSLFFWSAIKVALATIYLILPVFSSMVVIMWLHYNYHRNHSQHIHHSSNIQQWEHPERHSPFWCSPCLPFKQAQNKEKSLKVSFFFFLHFFLFFFFVNFVSPCLAGGRSS